MKELSIEDLEINPYTVFGKDWMALTAGEESLGFNTMTISWGHIGSIWDRTKIKCINNITLRYFYVNIFLSFFRYFYDKFIPFY